MILEEDPRWHQATKTRPKLGHRRKKWFGKISSNQNKSQRVDAAAAVKRVHCTLLDVKQKEKWHKKAVKKIHFRRFSNKIQVPNFFKLKLISATFYER